MTNESRAATLVNALRAGIEGDQATLRALLADDVRAWTPTLSTSSLTELIDELDGRDGAFTDFELEAVPLDVGGDFACVEWTVEMTHSGTIALTGEDSIEPSGTRVTLHGITVAEFADDQICSLRQYWDEYAVLEQLPR